MTDMDILKDHEARIRKLEDSDLKQQIQLANIEKSQAEIKVMINDTSKEQQKTLSGIMDRILDTITQNSVNTNQTDNSVRLHNSTNDNDTKNKVKFYNTKKFWAVASAASAALITYLTTR